MEFMRNKYSGHFFPVFFFRFLGFGVLAHEFGIRFFWTMRSLHTTSFRKKFRPLGLAATCSTPKIPLKAVTAIVRRRRHYLCTTYYLRIVKNCSKALTGSHEFNLFNGSWSLRNVTTRTQVPRFSNPRILFLEPIISYSRKRTQPKDFFYIQQI